MHFAPPPFRCHPLLFNNHAHTIAAALVPRHIRAPEAWSALASERLFPMPDGDQLLGVYHPHPDDEALDRPLVILLHGLEGSVDSHYVKGMSAKAFAVGLGSLRLNFRSCGASGHLASKLYNGALIDDVDQVIRQMAELGHRRIVVAGVSLGGNLLLKLLGSYGETPPEALLGAVAICPAIDMAATSVAFGEGFNRVYDRFFLEQLKERVKTRAQARPAEALATVAGRVHAVRSLREFDDLVTAPLNGFADAMDYYQKASSADDLGAIRVPTLLIAAQDDPFIPISAFKRREAVIEGNPCLVPVYPRHGGHVGFIEAPLLPQPEPWMDEYWAENQAVAFARALGQQAG